MTAIQGEQVNSVATRDKPQFTSGVLVFGLVLIQIIVSVLSGLFIWLRQLESPGCDGSCSLNDIYMLVVSYEILLIVLLGASIVASLLLRRTRWAISPSLASIVVIIVGAVVVSALISHQLQL
jgi:hypothetical protein